MTRTAPTSQPTTHRATMNWRRMLKVWGLLVVSMTVVALSGWATMPTDPPPGATASDVADPTALAALLWPKDLPIHRPWQYIVVHHSATPSGTLEAIAQHHRDRGFEEVGYHFLINNGRSAGTQDGQITPTPRWIEQAAGAHTSVARHPEFNNEGIGICLIGNFEKSPPTPAQMASLEMLVMALRNRYDIPLEQIVGHGEVKNTQCPGHLFPMETFLMDLRTAYLKGRLQAPGQTD